MTQDEALAKVSKLLALSKSDNPNEAALAASRAQEIMDKYKLEIAMLEIDGNVGVNTPDEEIKDFASPVYESERLSTWRLRLTSAIAKSNGCMVYITGGAIKLVGRPSDAETVRYLFAFLSSEIDRLTLRDCKGEGKTYANNFRLGAIETIKTRMAEEKNLLVEKMRAENANNPHAIVRLNTAIERIENRNRAVSVWVYNNMNLGTRRMGQGRYDDGAREAGRRAGREVQIGGARRALGA